MNTENIDEEIIEELADTLIVHALAALLKPDEGVILHHEGNGYVLFRNSEEEQIQLVEGEDFLKEAHGTLIWMHYKGSNAPEPEDGEQVLCNDNETRH